ncbi:gtp-binding protein 1-like [Stylonychia lemnae]|uniref:Gtp-binding protein 1-like n=1 Tax=Stylonychia lemnae TaxID=5949 RepID=A0A078B9C3_STYLE|nr:gtp-binding protein 1-like [Stylonychia lemnae]|eukprot:CDW91120.1 gtp-binding protein 1-like [Stylonychia lemnae]
MINTNTISLENNQKFMNSNPEEEKYSMKDHQNSEIQISNTRGGFSDVTDVNPNEPGINTDYKNLDKENKHRETLKIAVVGNVDSGKSTLTAVLSCPAGTTDDGRGSLREKVFNFGHEKENGRTSSIAHEILGFDEQGQQVIPLKKDILTTKKKTIWPEIVEGSSKVIQLIDLCGHEKYLRTTMFGLSGLYPQYSMLVVGANMGVSRMTKEHIGITMALKIPMFVVVTKLDLAPETVYLDTVNTLSKILKGSACNLKPILVKDSDDLDKIAEFMPNKTICPLFPISNVTGQGVTNLKYFLSKLPYFDTSSAQIDKELSDSQIDEIIESELVIDSEYNVKGVGLVVGGTITKGGIVINQILYLGPDKIGQFKAVVVKGIHENRVEVNNALKGQTVCINIKSLNKKEQNLKVTSFKKGMLLVGVTQKCLQNTLKKGGPSASLEALCVREFEAEVVILHHSTTIQQNYQAVLHCGGIRQSAKVLNIAAAKQDSELLRTGDKGLIRFRFMYYPELLKPGSTIMFREGRTKGLGFVTKVFSNK